MVDRHCRRRRGLVSVRVWVVVVSICLTAGAWGEVGVHFNGAFLFDEMGVPVHAHGGGVIQVGEYYYYFGEDRPLTTNRFGAVSCYRSKDLVHWEFRNHVLTSESDPELAAAKIERPKVVYNAATGKYVMWAHKENASDYAEARAAVAWCDTVDGDYTWGGSFRPLGHMSRDCTLFVDEDGTGYFLSASNNNQDLHLYRLTADYLAPAELVQKLWVGQSREAPCLFKRGGYYFIVSSGCTGWNPNQGKYGYATSLDGTWSGLVNLGNSTTYQSQPHYVLTVEGTEGTSYLYMGDRWAGAWGRPVNESRYVWLGLEFPAATTMTMPWHETIAIDEAAGTITAGPTQGWRTADDREAAVSYTAGWGTWNGNPGYLETEHYSEVTGSEATFTFTGVQGRYHGFLRNDLGYAEVFVDGEYQTSVDCYASSGVYNVVLYDTGELAAGEHTIMVRVAGVKNAASSGTEVIVDAFSYDTGGDQAVAEMTPGQSYRIACLNSGKVLTVGTEDVAEEGAGIVQYTDAGAPWQRWQFVEEGNGAYRVVNAASGKSLAIEAGGNAVVQEEYAGLARQRWLVAPRRNGVFELVNEGSGQVLDVVNGSIEEGAGAIVYDANGGLNQMWQIETQPWGRWERRFVEAETAAGQGQFWPWQAGADGMTPAGESIVVPEGTGEQWTATDGVAQYGLTLERRTRAKARLGVFAGDGASNSVFVRWDGEPWESVEVPVDAAWSWQWVGERTLGAGEHALAVAWREDGMMLDAVLFGLRSEPRADFNDDGAVNVLDLQILQGDWLATGTERDIWPEGTGDGVVNLHDAAVLAQEWDG